MEGAHFLKGFEGENVRKNKEKSATATENLEIKGLTFLVPNFLIFLFCSIQYVLIQKKGVDIRANPCTIIDGLRVHPGGPIHVFPTPYMGNKEKP